MSNTIVAEIHSAFSSAEQELLTEATRIIKDAKDDDKKARAQALTRMGFGRALPVRKLSKEEQEKADQLLFYKQRYDRIAPQYKFLTEEKLLSICKKYGLVVAGSERYIQDIPEANQEDITNFKILDESFLEINDDTYRNVRHQTREGEEMHPKDMGSGHIENLLNMFRRSLSREDQFGRYMSTGDVQSQKMDLIRVCLTELFLRGEVDTLERHKELWYSIPALNKALVNKIFTPMKTTYFYVAADVDSFDTKGAILRDNVLHDKSGTAELEEAAKDALFRYYDPIVMAKVQGGYLIVTAWGDEASDPEVANPNHN